MKAVLVIVAIVVVLALVFFAMYNRLVKLRNLVQEAWAQIDVELKRRHDLIGNLVETVKGYAAHEKGTLEEITRARAGAMRPGQGPAEAAQSEAALSQALIRLNAVAEAYPDLKANQNFTALQNELAATEDRIASARRYYNANVRELNTRIETVPTNVIAGIGTITKAEYFEVQGAEREVPQVSFGPGDAAAARSAGTEMGVPSGGDRAPSVGGTSAPASGMSASTGGVLPPDSSAAPQLPQPSPTPQDAPTSYGSPRPPQS